MPRRCYMISSANLRRIKNKSASNMRLPNLNRILFCQTILATYLSDRERQEALRYITYTARQHVAYLFGTNIANSFDVSPRPGMFASESQNMTSYITLEIGRICFVIFVNASLLYLVTIYANTACHSEDIQSLITERVGRMLEAFECTCMKALHALSFSYHC
jgi:hypothetical protein